jgi:hypothetical protein
VRRWHGAKAGPSSCLRLSLLLQRRSLPGLAATDQRLQLSLATWGRALLLLLLLLVLVLCKRLAAWWQAGPACLLLVWLVRRLLLVLPLLWVLQGMRRVHLPSRRHAWLHPPLQDQLPSLLSLLLLLLLLLLGCLRLPRCRQTTISPCGRSFGAGGQPAPLLPINHSRRHSRLRRLLRRFRLFNALLKLGPGALRQEANEAGQQRRVGTQQGQRGFQQAGHVLAGVVLHQLGPHDSKFVLQDKAVHRAGTEASLSWKATEQTVVDTVPAGSMLTAKPAPLLGSPGQLAERALDSCCHATQGAPTFDRVALRSTR